MCTEKIKFHLENKTYCKIRRKVGTDTFEKSSGYIVALSNTFVMLQETDDFIIRGYLIIPIHNIVEILCSTSDKYFDKIMKKEGITEKIDDKHKLDLESWHTIFNSIKSLKLNVIVQDENPESEDFTIGPITKVTEKSVFIQYFDPKCFLNTESTEIEFKKITVASFDDIYINILSKHLRKRKLKN